MTFFPEKIQIFTPKISDDLFSHRLGFSDCTSLYCRGLLECHIRPFLHKKNHYFRKAFLDKTNFLLCSYFRAHPTTCTTSLNIGRDQCMDRPPTSNCGGTVPPSPLGLPSARLKCLQ